MRHVLAYLAWLGLSLAPAVNADGGTPCLAMKLASESKNDRKRIALTPKAYELANCSALNEARSLDVLLESEILDWWVVHLPDEDIKTISSIAERNRAVLSKAMQTKHARDGGHFSFWGADLKAVLTVAVRSCSLQFKLSSKRHVYLSAFQEFEEENEGVCRGLAVMLAVHDIALDMEGENVLVFVPN